jgi:electron transfer flavoprotein alpha subunit
MKTLVVFPNKELLYAASTLGGEVAALVFSQKEAEAVSGKAHKILVAEVDPRLPDAAAEVVAKAAAGYDLVLMPSTKNAKTVGGMAAQKLGVELLVDVLSMRAEGGVLTAERYVFGNKAVATVQVPCPPSPRWRLGGSRGSPRPCRAPWRSWRWPQRLG